MRTASFKVDANYIFEILGMKEMCAKVDAVYVLDGVIYFKVSGGDFRLPDSENYPDCFIQHRVIESKIVPF